jgi:hypothetical protein
MKRRTLLLFLALAMVLVTGTIGCQGKKEKRGGIARGRDARGGDAGAKTSDRIYGGIYMDSNSGQDQNEFWQAVYTLTWAQLEGSEDEQLGYVSGNANSTSTGIRFWGDVKTTAKGIDGSKSSIHILIYDDAVADGADPITINIGGGIEGFVGASGSYSTTAANIVFEDEYGLIRLNGSISGGYFQGQVTYYTYQTGSQRELLLGHFKVKASGFFRN